MTTTTLYNERIRATVIEKIKSLPVDGSVCVEVKKVEEKRSLAQSRLFWMWTTEWASEVGYTKQEMHDAICREINGTQFSRGLDGKPFETIIGTRDLSVRGMCDFLTQMEALAGDQGIYLSHPEDTYYKAMNLI